MSARGDTQQAVVIGAGPYGLSVAAHLRASGIRFRIFGRPMHAWESAVPKGMLMKSDGFATSLSDPAGSFTLERYCAENGIAYDHTRIPVTLETFVAYGKAFQQRLVPELEPCDVSWVERVGETYCVTLADGETVSAESVIVAAGIVPFAWIPPELAVVPPPLVQHSSSFYDLECFRGVRVTVIGAGASAIDLAALLHEAGAETTLVARSNELHFHAPPEDKPPSLWQRWRHPSSGLGPGLRSRLCTDAPQLFRSLPHGLRAAIVRRHLGPAAGWPWKERVVGRVPLLLGFSVEKAVACTEGVCLVLRGRDGQIREHTADRVIAATGYKVDLRRLSFLAPQLESGLRQVQHAPVLRRDFQSSARGLYFVGITAANEFGPMFRFVYGADYAARQVTRTLGARLRRSRRSTSPALEAVVQ